MIRRNAIPIRGARRHGGALLVLAGLCAPGAFAAEEPARLGHIDFPNSGAPQAQEPFRRGVLLLHSFEYEDALTAFREAQAKDPAFALAYWGEAMTWNHPLWGEQDREAAREALARLAPSPEARRAKTATERERLYLAAVEALYGEGSKSKRDRAYLEAMRRLHEAYPRDLEAKAFYALAMLGSVPQREVRTYMRAAAVLEEVFAANPNHPGAAHYLIHCYDDPVHAPLGLRAARRYARIAPAATHAQHMISHIYTALGEWDEVVAANRKAVEVSEQRLRRLGQPLSGRSKHALLWLEYGLLQQGDFAEARETLEIMEADARADPSPSQLWHYAAMRAHYVVARPGATDIPGPLPPADAGLGATVLQAFASGLADLHAGDLEAAGNERRRIAEAVAAARVVPAGEATGRHHGAVTEDERLVADLLGRELEALLLYRRGDAAAALELLGEALADAAARPLEYGPPSVVKPVPELLGEMLLELGRPQEARAQFERALARHTSRKRSLEGLARAVKVAVP